MVGAGLVATRSRRFSGSGAHSTFAVGTNGTVYGWGHNYFGELGDGTPTIRPSAVTVSGYAGASNLAIGYGFSCGVMSAGTVKCSGSNEYGQLGNGTKTNHLSPVAVNSLSNIVQVVAGEHHACALYSSASGGSVACWGGNDFGQVGDGTPFPANPADQFRLTPTAVANP
jgi:alpha-tubulin suppressor-like RCC1 family protein